MQFFLCIELQFYFSFSYITTNAVLHGRYRRLGRMQAKLPKYIALPHKAKTERNSISCSANWTCQCYDRCSLALLYLFLFPLFYNSRLGMIYFLRLPSGLQSTLRCSLFQLVLVLLLPSFYQLLRLPTPI